MASEAIKRLRLVVSQTGAETTATALRGIGTAQKEVASAVSQTGGVIDSLQSRLSRLSSGGGLLGTALGLGAGFAGFELAKSAITSLVSTVPEAVTAFQKFQDVQVTLENVIRATGASAGKTAGDVLRLADSIGDINNTAGCASAALVSHRCK